LGMGCPRRPATHLSGHPTSRKTSGLSWSARYRRRAAAWRPPSMAMAAGTITGETLSVTALFLHSPSIIPRGVTGRHSRCRCHRHPAAARRCWTALSARRRARPARPARVGCNTRGPQLGAPLRDGPSNRAPGAAPSTSRTP
jgi:hypothetical protein